MFTTATQNVRSQRRSKYAVDNLYELSGGKEYQNLGKAEVYDLLADWLVPPIFPACKYCRLSSVWLSMQKESPVEVHMHSWRKKTEE